MLRIILLVCIGLIWTMDIVTARQGEGLPAAQAVTVTADDGLMLVGDYYPATTDSGHPRPAVLLLHMIGSNRESWSPLTPALTEAGYAALGVDLRGHGETGGEINWTAATADVQTWLDWLRGQAGVRADSISIIGASIGANLALIGCGNDPDCMTTIALSPGLVYYSLKTDEAVSNQLSNRSTLLIASQIDTYSAESVRQLFAIASGDVGAQLYAGTAHGTNLFDVSETVRDGLLTTIVGWLDEHTPAGSES